MHAHTQFGSGAAVFQAVRLTEQSSSSALPVIPLGIVYSNSNPGLPEHLVQSPFTNTEIQISSSQRKYSY
jgi:hypothetical protein